MNVCYSFYSSPQHFIHYGLCKFIIVLFKQFGNTWWNQCINSVFISLIYF
jgi:hypothetical protein